MDGPDKPVRSIVGATLVVARTVLARCLLALGCGGNRERMSAGNEIPGFIYAGMKTHLLGLFEQVVSKCTLLAGVTRNRQHIAEN